MVSEKHAFVAVAVIVAAFMGFLLISGSHASSQPGQQAGGAKGIASPGGPQAPAAQLQKVSVRALASGGYDNPSPTVKAGEPVKFDFSADPGSGCGRQLIIDGLGVNVNLISQNGQAVSATFTPPAPGQYRFHCGMNMFRGVLTAT